MKVCPVCGRAGSAAEARCPHDGAGLVLLDGAGGGRPTDLLGQVVDGRYRIEAVVGRGGMGTVYAARHVVVGRAVALKVLRPGLEHREEALARFVREAQAANAVRSRHILRADDFGQMPDGSLYVVMELLEGRSLGVALRERLLGREELLRIFVQMADALHAAHAAGVVHRDLKPDNVFLVDDPAERPSVRILDFGVAKLVHADAGLTSTGVILGTPHYMAPEQARGQRVDHRADVYALGVVMYQAFTGHLPFVADSAVGVLTAHAVDEPAPPSRSGVDARLEQVILRCMRKAPDERFASMGELSAALRAIAGSSAGALPPAPTWPITAGAGAATGAAPAGGQGALDTAVSGSIVGVGAGALGPTGPETSAGLTTATAAPVSRGLYLALGAGLATVGVVVALLVATRGAIGGAATAGGGPAAEPASAAPPPTGASTGTGAGTGTGAETGPGTGSGAGASTAEVTAAPSATGAASASVGAAAPAGAQPPAGRPSAAGPARGAAPRPARTSAPPPSRPRPGEIRSPFD